MGSTRVRSTRSSKSRYGDTISGNYFGVGAKCGQLFSWIYRRNMCFPFKDWESIIFCSHVCRVFHEFEGSSEPRDPFAPYPDGHSLRVRGTWDVLVEALVGELASKGYANVERGFGDMVLAMMCLSYYDDLSLRVYLETETLDDLILRIPIKTVTKTIWSSYMDSPLAASLVTVFCPKEIHSFLQAIDTLCHCVKNAKMSYGSFRRSQDFVGNPSMDCFSCGAQCTRIRISNRLEKRL